MVRALSLFSGSLASLVATRLVELSDGVDEVQLLSFRSPFFTDYERVREIAKRTWPAMQFRSQAINKDYQHLVGILSTDEFSLARSCYYCRTLMLTRAAQYMKRIKADFIVTGEIEGSNGLTKCELERISTDAGISDLVLRPLSAKLLSPTRPEQAGWVNAENLYDLQVGDKERLAKLAFTLNLVNQNLFDRQDRCKLTRPNFGPRLADLLCEKEFTLNGLRLLDFSYYYKKGPDVTIVLAIEIEEKRNLQNFFLPQDARVYLPTHQGPLALVRTDWTAKKEDEIAEIIELAGRMIAIYSAAAHHEQIQINYRFENKNETISRNISPFADFNEINRYAV
ncbi:hypothetical protein LM597_03325 [Candidatus Acetothermia bacterium]|nr:hypothetical protein [Candidatus Acetothermia bacterium]